MAAHQGVVNMGATKFLLPLLLTVAVLAAVARADEAIDPQEIRVITATSATSNCIGDPKTPVCAAETMMACFARLDLRLCEHVGVDASLLQLPKIQENVRYQVLTSHVIRSEDIPPELQDVYWMKPGYVEITILEMDFIPSGGSSNEPPMGWKISYVTKSTASGWQIVSWALWSADEPDN